MAASILAGADGRAPELLVPIPITIHEPPPETPFVASPTRGNSAASGGYYSGFAGVVKRRRAVRSHVMILQDSSGIPEKDAAAARGARGHAWVTKEREAPGAELS